MTATVICGPERHTTEQFVGSTVAEIRDDLSGVMNIADDTTPFVNARSVDEGYTLKDGDELIFSRPLGQKG